MILKKTVAAAVASLLGVTALTSQAEGLAASVKTFGMAATGVANPMDALAGAFNPAGHVEIGDRLDLGITWSRDWGHSKIKGNILDSIPLVSASLGAPVNGTYKGYKTKNNYAPDFGINKRLGACDEWAVGLIVYNRNFSKTTYNKPFVLFGTSNAGMEYVHQTISPVLAYKWNECHNFGLTVNYMVQRLKVNGIEKLDKPPTLLNPLGTTHVGHVTNKGYQYSTGWSFTLGWQWHITPCVTFGLTYQPETSMTKLKKYKGFPALGKLNVPAMYSAGIAWKLQNCITVAFDYQRYEWQNIRGFHNPLEYKGVVQLLGSKNGPGFGFKSQNFYRFGVNWDINETWSIRAGYRYGNTPIRCSQTVVNQFTLDTVESFLTLGTTYRLNCCHEFSGFFAYGFPKKIKGKDSIPPGIPNTFVASLLNQPFGFGGGESDLTAGKFALGVSWGWNY